MFILMNSFIFHQNICWIFFFIFLLGLLKNALIPLKGLFDKNIQIYIRTGNSISRFYLILLLNLRRENIILILYKYFIISTTNCILWLSLKHDLYYLTFFQILCASLLIFIHFYPDFYHTITRYCAFLM